MGTSADRRRPVALTIAGSDNSGGAGIQADLKTFSRLGCYGLTTVTCVVSEAPGRVAGIQPVKPSLVASQIALSLDAFPVGAAKTGMLYSTAIIEVVADALAGSDFPLVIDPVMVASSGDPLLKPSAVAAYRRLLFPRARLITPNLDELQVLTGRRIGTLRQMEEAGRELVDHFGCAFLLKGGHLRGTAAIDLLVTASGVREYTAPFVRGGETHGTGCTYSAAITAGLARGESLERAVAGGKKLITRAIGGGLRWGKTGALDHFA